MATKHTRLVRRGAVYYFGCKIPVDLVRHYGKREILESLRTRDAKEARRLNAARSEKQEQEFDRIRAGRTITELTDEQVQAIADEHYAGLLYWDEREREQGLSEEDYEARNAEVISVDSFAPAALARNDVKRGGYITHLALKWRGITLPKDSPSYRRLTYALLKATVKANDAVRARQDGKVVDTPRAPAAILVTPQAARASRSSATLAELLPRWEREREPTPRARQEWGLIVRRFNALHGELPVDLVEKKHVIAYKDKMLKDEAAAATINKHLGAIASLLQLATDNDLCAVNVARGVRVRGRKVPEESRLPYDIEDLKQIFSSPVFTAGLRPIGGAGEAAYWLPLLALWTGCRLEELGQALVADVQEANGVHYLDISDLGEGMSVKTTGSRRSVPIHPELVRLGFLRYVDGRRVAGDERVFPLLRQNSYGRWTQNWSKWWRSYARGTVGIADTRKVFHSFRHTFIRQCRECGIEEEQRIAITGHAGGTVGRAYGGHYPLRPLAEAMQKLRYPGLHLMDLKKESHAG